LSRLSREAKDNLLPCKSDLSRRNDNRCPFTETFPSREVLRFHLVLGPQESGPAIAVQIADNAELEKRSDTKRACDADALPSLQRLEIPKDLAQRRSKLARSPIPIFDDPSSFSERRISLLEDEDPPDPLIRTRTLPQRVQRVLLQAFCKTSNDRHRSSMNRRADLTILGIILHESAFTVVYIN